MQDFISFKFTNSIQTSMNTSKAAIQDLFKLIQLIKFIELSIFSTQHIENFVTLLVVQPPDACILLSNSKLITIIINKLISAT